MPKVEDIERFKLTLNSLGNEPEILKERGEEIEEPTIGAEELLADLSELLEGTEGEKPEEAEGLGTEAGRGEVEGEREPEAGEGEAPAESEEETLAGEEAGPSEESILESELPELDLESLFGEEAPEVEATPGGEAPAAEAGTEGEAGLPEAEETAEEAAAEERAEEEFEIPVFPEEEAEEGGVEGKAEEETEGPPLEEVTLEEAPSEEALSEEGEITPGEPEGFEALEGLEFEEEPEIPEEGEMETREAPKSEEEHPEEKAAFPEAPEESEEIESIDQIEIPEDFSFEEPTFSEEEVEGVTEETTEAGFEGLSEETAFAGFEEEGKPTPEEAPPAEEEKVGGEEGEEVPFEGEEEFVLDEFALPEFGEFEEEKKEEKAEEAFVPLEEVAPEEAVTPEEIELTDEQFEILKKTLTILPINLKIRIEELIANEEIKGAKLKGLLDLLTGGASPHEIAAYVSKVTGKRIRIPKAYEKRAGIAFEREKRTFAYALRENILPVATSVFLTLIVLGLFSFLTYRFIYSPLHAINLYKQGYNRLEANRYESANSYFEKAKKIWDMKPWYYKYADGFTEKRQFLLAEKKYDELLESFPGDRKGILDYARLESRYMANYEKADRLLKVLLDRDMYDYDALLAQGDNYLEWAREDPSKYEKARFSYATILDRYGEKREVLFRMLKYFIRTNQYGESEKLFLALEEDKNAKVDAKVYAELAGYFIDKNKLEHVSDILSRAMKSNLTLPDVHYQLSRYYGKIKEIGEEKKALNYTIKLLEGKESLSPEYLKMLIASYDRLGELYYNEKEVITAERNFRNALKILERAVSRKILKPQKLFGNVYEHLGNISYYIDNDLDTALSMFSKARQNGLNSIELNYKVGYIRYMKGDYRNSLLEFAKVVTEFPNNWNSMYAMANTLYFREDYSASQGYYLQLLEQLEARRESIRYINIESNPKHRNLIEYLVRVYNNIGVTIYKLSQRTGDRKKFSQALVDLTRASEFYDVLTRNPVTMRRTLTKNLAYLNMNGILHPQTGFEPQIYRRIQKDMKAISF